MSTPTTPARSGRRMLSHIVRIAAVIYLGALLVMLMLENRLIFLPARYPDGDWQPKGLKFEDAWFEAADGTQLHGWYIPHKAPSAVVLFAHGNAGNLSHRAEFLRAMHDLVGVSILIFDYRGYGRSAGSPSEQGVLLDARAARKWLSHRAGVEAERIVLMGESLGGAVIVDLAARDGAGGLILENTFASLPEVAAYHYRWLPVQRFMRSQFNSAEKIRDYHGPLLQFHGDADTIIPIEFGRRLFAAANEPKQFVVLHGADHNDPRRPQIYKVSREFLERLNVSEYQH